MLKKITQFKDFYSNLRTMKYKLLAVSNVSAINIGDYVQALAASQFYPTIDGFIEREFLDEEQSEYCKAILNGYYMHDSKHWPPSNKIRPLLVAIHINSLVRERFAADDSINFFKKYEPVGCRDYDTVDFLKSHGVNAYFSGCLTLTIGYKYKYNGKRNGLYFVDPKVTFKNKLEKVIYYILSFFMSKNVHHIGKKIFEHDILSISERSFIAKFLVKYSKLFNKNDLLSANYIRHESTKYNTNFATNDDRLKEAERLIKCYSKAALVVTSRIHCALPCLGLETPVIFVNNKEQSEWSSCRLRGLIDFFNVIEWTYSGLSTTFPFEGKISISNYPNNKDCWRSYAESLIEKCSFFMKL